MSIHLKLADLQKAREVKYSELAKFIETPGYDANAYALKKKAVEDIDLQIRILADVASLAVGPAASVPAAPENDPYIREKSLVIGGMARMAAAGGMGKAATARAVDVYGDRHPVTKALNLSSATAGGFLVPPDVMADVSPVLRAQTVVRAAGPRELGMPRGTMTMNEQRQAATAFYGGETSVIPASQPGFGQRVASYKKLTALVPISNDLIRYSSPGADAIARDDLIQVMARREDQAFLMGDGSGQSPYGLFKFANNWAALNGGTQASYSKTAASVMGANGPTDPDNSTAGNFISSNASYTLATANQELTGAAARLDQANVPKRNRVWFMNPRSYWWLATVQNSLGMPAYPSVLADGTLLGYPIMQTTLIGTTYWDAGGSNKDLSFVMLAEMSEMVLFDSMALEMMMSNQASFTDTDGNTVSCVQKDLTLLRAISEHDLQSRHDQAVAIVQGVRWSPAIV